MYVHIINESIKLGYMSDWLFGLQIISEKGNNNEYFYFTSVRNINKVYKLIIM